MNDDYHKAILDYFERKAEHYDDVDQQAYWVFSDSLLWSLLVKFVLPRDPAAPFRLLDAGGGTGRWSNRVLENYAGATVQLVDLSPHMLSVARHRFSKRGFDSRGRVVQGDVRSLDHAAAGEFDSLFSFHNVLGFVPELDQALHEFRRVLRPGGVAALMFPNRYHALYFSLANGRMREVDRVMNAGSVRFADDMPDLRVFTPAYIEQSLAEAGFQTVAVHGFPVTLYPGVEETRLHGATEKLQSLLGDSERRLKLLELETALCSDPSTSARGNNLLAIAR